ncbi:hypothetical protein P9112_000992 [Eukaryota sp. TZLM1-RC]
MTHPDRLTFILHYHDPQAELNRVYNLLFFPSDNSIEIHDPKLKRIFLRRIPFPSLSLNDFIIGNSVDIHSRQMKVADYGDSCTRDYLTASQETITVVIPPSKFPSFGTIIQSCLDANLRPTKLRCFSSSSCKSLDRLSSLSNEPSGVVCFFKLTGNDCLTKWATISSSFSLPPVDDFSTIEQVFQSVEYNPCPVDSENSSLLLIKPHCVKHQKWGDLIGDVMKNFAISTIGSFNFTREQAAEFLEVYRGVLNEYDGWCKDLSSGMVVACHIKGDDVMIVNQLRDWVGPVDPEIAKQLAPNSIRARYGKNRIFNAVHTTDLIDDGSLEVHYLFEFMWKYGN